MARVTEAVQPRDNDSTQMKTSTTVTMMKGLQEPPAAHQSSTSLAPASVPDCYELCLLVPPTGVVLVYCGHERFVRHVFMLHRDHV